jgi:hypothetical protein
MIYMWFTGMNYIINWPLRNIVTLCRKLVELTFKCDLKFAVNSVRAANVNLKRSICILSPDLSTTCLVFL